MYSIQSPHPAAWPSLYYANVTGGTLLHGKHTYLISASLLETQNRPLQLAEGHGGLRFTAAGASPTREWFRYRLCLGQAVHLRPSKSSSPQVPICASET